MQTTLAAQGVCSNAVTRNSFIHAVRPQCAAPHSRPTAHTSRQQPQAPSFARSSPQARLATIKVSAYATEEYAGEEPEITYGQAEVRYGDVINGVVDGVRPYGAFVKINDTDQSGLLHISEISGTFVDNIDDVMKVGEPVRCLVLRVDRRENRISLSTKRLERNSGDMLSDRQAVFDGADDMAAIVREEWARRRAEKQAQYEEEGGRPPRREYRERSDRGDREGGFEGRGRGGGGRGGGRGGGGRGGGRGRGGYRQERRERDWE